VQHAHGTLRQPRRSTRLQYEEYSKGSRVTRSASRFYWPQYPPGACPDRPASAAIVLSMRVRRR
jgi:hypothetical protein